MAKNFYRFEHKKVIRRLSPCCVCNSIDGLEVGALNYFNLQTFSMVQCNVCGLITTDPIPDAGIIAKGSEMLYSFQQSAEKRNRILRGFGRSYRRGMLFAKKYLQKLSLPKNPKILEVGAGDGYFSRGIKTIFPDAEVTLLDIVPELIEFYKKHHLCNTICGVFSKSNLANKKFDLIICRDLVEHLSNPYLFFSEAKEVLNEKGKIFIITPNGLEDFWMINQKYIKYGQPYNMILNHFNYFLPQTLDYIFEKLGFIKKIAFKYDLNGHKKGLGYKSFDSFEEAVIPSQVKPIKSSSFQVLWSHKPDQVAQTFLNTQNLLSNIYSYFKDTEKDLVDYYDRKGHEFFIIIEKV
jgi:2-polyprenyl-3-methyl-5-hydroxy-6-metoxy-1,4-benzoquinol methylase